MAGVRFLEDGRACPVEDELTATFWDAARRNVLVRQRCDECGSSFFSPQFACPSCLSERWSWAESNGRGTVYSYTVCHRAPGPGYPTPYVLAIIDLENEGWSMLSNVVGCEPGAVGLGLRVRVTWQQIDEGHVLPVFTPEEDQ